MKVEIWSDVVCPWCYVGKRRFEAALGAFEHRDGVEVVWHSFELDPSAPAVVEGDAVDRLASKYGMSRAQADAANRNLSELGAADGLDLRLSTTRSGNSFDAHRLAHLADAERPDLDLRETLFAAYFTANEAIGDRDTLAAIATGAGLDAGRVAEVLAGDEYAEAVRTDEREAGELGISGVPFFVIDRKYGISGAQPAEQLTAALTQIWGEGDVTPAEGESCGI